MKRCSLFIIHKSLNQTFDQTRSIKGGRVLIQFKTKQFTVFQSRLFKTTSTVIHTNDCIIVVDPTWLPDEVKEIQAFVEEIKGSRPIYLLFTHSDWDHVLGYGAFPNSMVIASEEFDNRTDKEAILEQIKSFDDEYYLDRPYPIAFPNVDILVRHDGQILNIGDTTLTFYKANGHTNDGIFTIVESLGVWIAGDYLSDVEFPYIYHSSVCYEKTLNKTEKILEQHEIQYLIPGHGHITASQEEMLKRKRESLHYILELRQAILTDSNGDYLLEGYSYLRGMQGFHEENIKLVKKELEKSL